RHRDRPRPLRPAGAAAPADPARGPQRHRLRHRPHGARRMRTPSRFIRRQKMTIVNGILAISLILVSLQLWLLTATMNAYLGGQTGILLPAALASALCLALIGGLLWYLYALDR